MKPKVIIIGGPTASGKTGLSVELAKRINGEIISADSMQIYKHLNVGTAKVTKEEMQGIKHYLIDIVEPSEEFSVADFQKLAYEKIEEILSKGKVPIIAGGTGLYISSLVDNMVFLEEDEETIKKQKEFEKKIEKMGENAPELMYEELLKIDKEAAEKISKNNTKRVKRALEMYYTTGKTKTEQEKYTIPENSKYEFITFIIDWPRDVLYNRINERVEIMVNSGLIEETKWLLKQNLNTNLTAMKAIGYKELCPYLRGEATLEECTEVLKMETRRYAKRQITWFKRIKGVKYINYSLETEEKIEYILENI